VDACTPLPSGGPAHEHIKKKYRESVVLAGGIDPVITPLKQSLANGQRMRLDATVGSCRLTPRLTPG